VLVPAGSFGWGRLPGGLNVPAAALPPPSGMIRPATAAPVAAAPANSVRRPNLRVSPICSPYGVRVHRCRGYDAPLRHAPPKVVPGPTSSRDSFHAEDSLESASVPPTAARATRVPGIPGFSSPARFVLVLNSCVNGHANAAIVGRTREVHFELPFRVVVRIGEGHNSAP
jgi:hypothetical protein